MSTIGEILSLRASVENIGERQDKLTAMMVNALIDADKELFDALRAEHVAAGLVYQLLEVRHASQLEAK